MASRQSDNIVNTSGQPKTEYELEFWLLLGMVFLIVMGVLMAIFSLTYIHDLATLRNVPDLIWNFACGKPLEGETSLPLLLTLSIVSFGGSVALGGWRWWIQRKNAPVD